MDKLTFQKNSRKTFCNFMDKKKDKMLGQILTLVEVLVPNKFQWEKTRKNILGICNDFCRNLQFELEEDYVMDYIKDAQTIIEVHLPKIIPLSETEDVVEKSEDEPEMVEKGGD